MTLSKNSVSDVLRWSAEKLRAVNSERAIFESRLLLANILGCRPEILIADDQRIILDEQLVRFKSLVERRQKFEPMAYLLGEKEFYGRPFVVDKNVLIPRPETEGLVKLVLDWVSTQKIDRDLMMLDLGTGTGCIGITLDKECTARRKIFALDKSEPAIDIARQNNKNLNARVNFILGDICDGPQKYFPREFLFDVIVSNPPYIPDGQLNNLQPDIRDFEPMSALLAGSQGLDFYHVIFQKWLPMLQKGGLLALECEGASQISLIMKTFDSSVEFESLSPYLLVRPKFDHSTKE